MKACIHLSLAIVDSECTLYILVKTVVLSGKAPVDPDCTLVGKAHVFYEGKDVWDCMLNQVRFGTTC